MHQSTMKQVLKALISSSWLAQFSSSQSSFSSILSPNSASSFAQEDAGTTSSRASSERGSSSQSSSYASFSKAVLRLATAPWSLYSWWPTRPMLRSGKESPQRVHSSPSYAFSSLLWSYSDSSIIIWKRSEIPVLQSRASITRCSSSSRRRKVHFGSSWYSSCAATAWSSCWQFFPWTRTCRLWPTC